MTKRSTQIARFIRRLLITVAASSMIGLGAVSALAQNQSPPTNTAAPQAPTAQNQPQVSTQSVPQEPKPGPPESSQTISATVYTEMFKILFAVFAIALVMESALAVIFNWRLFLAYFDSRGAKTLFSVIAGIAVAVSLKLDLIDRLYTAMNGQSPGLGIFGFVLTGLVLAGGSSGVNNILKGLGFRSQQDEVTKVPKPRPTEAWLAVELKRIRATEGPVQVFLTRDNEGERLIGTINGRAPIKFLARLRPNPMRFPAVAGFAVPADSTVIVQLRAPKLPAVESSSRAWGPYTVAGGAIIDFELEL